MYSNTAFSPLPHLAWLALTAVSGPWSLHGLTLDLQRRDPVTGAVTIQSEEVDPKRVGVIAVDVWNYHQDGQHARGRDRTADEPGPRGRSRPQHDGHVVPE